MLRSLLLFLAVFFAIFNAPTSQAQDLGLHPVLAGRILAPNQPLVEVKAYTASRVPPLTIRPDQADWKQYADEIRARTLNDVIFRGEARAWRDARTHVEWLETIDGGPGYRIKKLRYEALPGLWIPALLYEPNNLTGKVPVVLNVNGHAVVEGKALEYKQIRCINQAKRGILALNVEWFGMGQLNTPGFGHYKMNQLDLTGSSGIAPFYLAMKRAIDLLLEHEHADPERVAVTGLSGGGWQTIFISSLDERVALADAVAGYSSFVTRAQFPQYDLGDSEQTPSDLATVVDYTHLTALRAPRPTLLTYNARDTCCFRAEYALAPLLQAAKPAFQLFDRPKHLRSHINQDAGHNYGQDNREAFYRMLRDFFFGGSPDFDVSEISVDDELKTPDQLEVSLPADNLDFHQIAVQLAADLPRNNEIPADARSAENWRREHRDKLREITRTPRYVVEAKAAGESVEGSYKTTKWKLHMEDSWTVPAVELQGETADGTVIVLADGGRTSAAGEIRELLKQGRRVVAVDPFYFGESTIETEDFLYAILVAALGERPLGIQAGQITATARWAKQRYGEPVEVHAIGPRTSLIALIASALEPDAIAGARVVESFGSLGEIISSDLGANQTPELFCFGLFKAFDIPGIVALSAPRPVDVVGR